MKHTGSLSRIADFIKPLVSAGSIQLITFNPGQLASQDSNIWLCCCASWPAEPLGPRKTIGQEKFPADCDKVLAALFTIWSKASTAKFHVINSTIGRNPFMAAP